MKKISTLLFGALLIVCMVSCNSNGDDNKITLARHWTGDKTELRFDVLGNVMTPEEFANYLNNSVLLKKQYEDYIPYIEQLSEFEITDFTFNKDNTYEIIMKNYRTTKTLTGDWMQVNDKVTIFIDLSQAFEIQDSGNWDLDILELTLKNLHLSGKLDVVDGTIAIRVDFYGKR